MSDIPSSSSATQTSPTVVHLVQVPAQSQSFNPWTLFVLISIGLFLAYLYYSYTSSITPKLEEKESPFVTEVTSQEVSSSVLSGDGTVKVVLLYATWCEHCRIMIPAYNAAAESTRQIRWLKVEQTNAGPILKARSDIRGFPTIFGVKQNGEIVQYGEREPRTEESLRKWGLQLLQDTSATLLPISTSPPLPQESINNSNTNTSQPNSNEVPVKEEEKKSEVQEPVPVEVQVEVLI
jgi:thiol-disulfide isomerase/thioredoxin